MKNREQPFGATHFLVVSFKSRAVTPTKLRHKLPKHAGGKKAMPDSPAPRMPEQVGKLIKRVPNQQTAQGASRAYPSPKNNKKKTQDIDTFLFSETLLPRFSSPSQDTGAVLAFFPRRRRRRERRQREDAGVRLTALAASRSRAATPVAGSSPPWRG